MTVVAEAGEDWAVLGLYAGRFVAYFVLAPGSGPWLSR